MATFYADFDLGTGSNNGTSWTDAWRSMADVIAGAISAGDTIYCRGTDTVSSSPTWSQSGDETLGMIKLIGVDGSGNNVGGTTRAVIDANSNSIPAFICNAPLVYFENFAFTGSANDDGFNGTGDYLALINCVAYSNGAAGFDLSQSTYDIVLRCAAYSNTLSGYTGNGGGKFMFSSARDNTASGFSVAAGCAYIGCLAYDNGDGFSGGAGNTLVHNCVIDQNTDDGFVMTTGTRYHSVVIGCRITNQSGEASDIGLNCGGEIVIYGWNYIFHNGDNIANDSLSIALLHDGSATNTIETEDSGNYDLDGYVSITEGSEDYNLTSSATLRRTAISIPTS